MYTYVLADEALRERLGREWGRVVADHMPIQTEEGFSLVALAGDTPAGVIGVLWQQLPGPLPGTKEAFINIIEVHRDFRRQGIARELVVQTLKIAAEAGAYQVRAWSSEDKVQAIPMWRALGFGLCPAEIFPGGKTIRGFYVARVIREEI